MLFGGPSDGGVQAGFDGRIPLAHHVDEMTVWIVMKPDSTAACRGDITPVRVQFNSRLETGLRDRIRFAANMYRLSERELIERFAATLPAPPPAAAPPHWLK